MPRQSLAVKASRKPSAITADRVDAIGQMNTPLQRRLAVIEKSVNDVRAENLRYYYKIGKVCEEIREKPEIYVGKDGTHGLKLVERALSTQARMLRKAAMFAREYSEQDLKQLVDLTNPTTGFQLHWGHVSFLLTLPSTERREKYAQEAVDKMLDPPALHDLIKKRTNRTEGHGRSHMIPKTIGAQIRQMLTICRAWTGKNTDVWNGATESVFGNIMNMPPDDMEPEMVTQLEEVEVLMQEIADASAENIGRSQRVREYLSAAIITRDAAAAAAAAAAPTGRRSRAIDLGGRTTR